MNDLLLFFSNLISLLLLLCFKYINPIGDIGTIALIFSFSPAFIYLVAFIITFWGRLSYLRPSWKYVNFSLTNGLLGLGVQFFVIQITNCVILYTSTNFIISHTVDNYSVTIYNLAYKYYQIVTMGFTIVLVPFWSSVTDAYGRQDFVWLKRSYSKMLRLFVCVLVVVVLMFFLSPLFYHIWIGDSVLIPHYVNVMLGLYVVLYNWSNLSIYFINGFGKIRVQLIVSIFSAVIYIPFALFLGNTYGLLGVLFASCLNLIPLSIMMPIQVFKIINKKSSGLWNK